MREAVVYKWKPIEPPSDPRALASSEVPAFKRTWESLSKKLKERGVYSTFWERLARRWSIETGVIERVYDLSVGATEILVQHGFSANLIQHEDSDTDPERLVQILKDHRDGLTMVMDLIGGRRQLTVGWTKELHDLLCRHQETVVAREAGPLQRLIEIPFQHGVFKSLPNNPTLEAGVHEYCPPEHVASEMDRLVELYRQIPEDLPEVRAAWLHHAFTQIHPFQDGNGRVARALASIDFIRCGLFPLVVDRTRRDREYMPALQRADSGDIQPLVKLFVECQEEAILAAVSVAGPIIEEAGNLRAVLAAARDRIEDRRRTDIERKHQMAERIESLASVALIYLQDVATQVTSSLPEVRAKAFRSKQEDEHYWRAQVIQLARARRYFADLREPRRWVRLQLRDGGLTDLIVVLHFVGNPSPGSSVSGAFLIHRDSREHDVTAGETVYLSSNPLLLTLDEDAAAQEKRFREWLSHVVLLGLAEWKKQL